MRAVMIGVAVVAMLGCGGKKQEGPTGGTGGAGPDETPDAAGTVQGPDASGGATDVAKDSGAPMPDLRLAEERAAPPVDGPPVMAVPPVITQFQKPDDKCLVSTVATPDRLVQGTLDLGLDHVYPYLLFPVVTLEQGAPEILISFLHVKISDPPGVTVPWPVGCPTEFDVRFGALPFPGGSSASGTFEVLQACHGMTLRDLFAKGTLDRRLETQVRLKVTVNVKAYIGNQPVPSAPVDFPLRVCVGCLQTGFATPFDKYDYPKVPLCTDLQTNPFPGNPCTPAQDSGPILCCARVTSGVLTD